MIKVEKPMASDETLSSSSSTSTPPDVRQKVIDACLAAEVGIAEIKELRHSYDKLASNLGEVVQRAASDGIADATKEFSEQMNYLSSAVQRLNDLVEDHLLPAVLNCQNQLDVIEGKFINKSTPNKFDTSYRAKETETMPSAMEVIDEVNGSDEVPNKKPLVIKEKQQVVIVTDGILSSDDQRPLKVGGLTFHSIQQAYQYIKAVYHKDMRTAAAIKCSPSPALARQKGTGIKNIASEWPQIEPGVLLSLLRLKAEQCERFREIILKKSADVIFGYSAGNSEGILSHWTVGHTRGTSNLATGKWQGKNLYGKMLRVCARKYVHQIEEELGDDEQIDEIDISHYCCPDIDFKEDDQVLIVGDKQLNGIKAVYQTKVVCVPNMTVYSGGSSEKSKTETLYHTLSKLKKEGKLENVRCLVLIVGSNEIGRKDRKLAHIEADYNNMLEWLEGNVVSDTCAVYMSNIIPRADKVTQGDVDSFNYAVLNSFRKHPTVNMLDLSDTFSHSALGDLAFNQMFTPVDKVSLSVKGRVRLCEMMAEKLPYCDIITVKTDDEKKKMSGLSSAPTSSSSRGAFSSARAASRGGASKRSMTSPSSFRPPATKQYRSSTGGYSSGPFDSGPPSYLGSPQMYHHNEFDLQMQALHELDRERAYLGSSINGGYPSGSMPQPFGRF